MYEAWAPIPMYNKEEPQTIKSNGWGASQIKSMKKQELIDKLMIISNTELTVSISVNDVIRLVSELEDGSFALTESIMNDMVNAISDSIESDGMDLIDGYDLSMDYREVTVDSVDYDTRSLKNSIRSAIDDYIEVNKEELIVVTA